RQVTVRGQDELTELAGGANHLLGEIAAQVHVLERLSRTDALTGLANRRSFTERLEQAMRRRQRRNEALTLLLLDVDHFKAYNDRYGHQRGDLALQAVAACLAGAARRPGDLVARLGGEEFALLLQHTDRSGARHCAEEIRSALAVRAVTHAAGGASGRLTLSMGLAEALPDETPDSLYQRADAALYRAKADGRDRVAE
ncbi:MAG TPA: GGDEF domain-containing protein, partial [Roseateles sp.]|nr:GGDEF domain-containing protein [Roseateles sp.]